MRAPSLHGEDPGKVCQSAIPHREVMELPELFLVGHPRYAVAHVGLGMVRRAPSRPLAHAHLTEPRGPLRLQNPRPHDLHAGVPERQGDRGCVDGQAPWRRLGGA